MKTDKKFLIRDLSIRPPLPKSEQNQYPDDYYVLEATLVNKPGGDHCTTKPLKEIFHDIDDIINYLLEIKYADTLDEAPFDAIYTGPDLMLTCIKPTWRQAQRYKPENKWKRWNVPENAVYRLFSANIHWAGELQDYKHENGKPNYSKILRNKLQWLSFGMVWEMEGPLKYRYTFYDFPVQDIGWITNFLQQNFPDGKTTFQELENLNKHWLVPIHQWWCEARQHGEKMEDYIEKDEIGNWLRVVPPSGVLPKGTQFPEYFAMLPLEVSSLRAKGLLNADIKTNKENPGKIDLNLDFGLPNGLTFNHCWPYNKRSTDIIYSDTLSFDSYSEVFAELKKADGLHGCLDELRLVFPGLKD